MLAIMSKHIVASPSRCVLADQAGVDASLICVLHCKHSKHSGKVNSHSRVRVLPMLCVHIVVCVWTGAKQMQVNQLVHRCHTPMSKFITHANSSMQCYNAMLRCNVTMQGYYAMLQCNVTMQCFCLMPSGHVHWQMTAKLTCTTACASALLEALLLPLWYCCWAP